MDVQLLNNKLIEQPENIVKVLTKINFNPNLIKYSEQKHMLTSPLPDGDNPHGLIIYDGSLKTLLPTRGWEGNIYTLIMRQKQCNFPKALDYIASWLGISYTPIRTVYPFGGFYKSIIRDANNENIELPEIKIELPPADNYSYKFVREGISVQTQKEYGIRYSHEDDSILIPINDLNGRMVGVKARNNNDDDFHKRWWAWTSYNKNSVVYGLYKNYTHIVNKGILYLFESEKSVGQCHSMQFNYAGALGGHTISERQALIIKSLMLNKIILCCDSDIPEDEVIYNAKKLIVNNNFYHNKVGYLKSELPPELKLSPTDLGYEAFKKLATTKVKWIKGENGR